LAIILPNVLMAVLSGAFLTFAIVIGEFTMAALLDRPAFGPTCRTWREPAYEPAALAVIAFRNNLGLHGADPGSRRPLRAKHRKRTLMAFLEIEHLQKILRPDAGRQGLQPRTSTRASSSRFLVRRAAARRQCCAWWPASRTPTSGAIRISGKDMVPG
jgi:hypothetical protein